jgi:hypothetical protein
MMTILIRNKYLLGLLVLCLFSTPLFAQTLNVGILENISDSVRRAQLLGVDTSNSSFMIRPVSQSHLRNYSRELYRKNDDIYVSALPVVWQQQYTSHHPYGWNDGAMIPAKGYQTMFSAGIYAKIGFLSIQFQPEVVYAANQDFKKISDENNEVGKNYYGFYNSIDMPERFGEGSYRKFSLGQSSIRLNFDPVSFGVSNENLWWGPGMRNSLLMSNNAPGFKHVTLNTTRPINTPVGSFEAQLIGGRLDASGVDMPSKPGYRAKRQDWRYLSGIALTYNPKWLPQLYLGFDKTSVAYRADLGNHIKNFIPLLNSSALPTLAENSTIVEESISQNHLLSLSARWVMPEAKSELYFQYGREDWGANGRDMIAEPEHSRAYIIGFRKILPLQRIDGFVQIGLELTQMENGSSSKVRHMGYWYTHSSVRQGYTHMGQVLGAGIGPGSNLQTLDVSWVKGLKRIGLVVDRVVQNNNLMYRSGALDYRRHWVDLGFTGKFSWDYKNFVLNSGITYVHSFNYHYVLDNGEAWDWSFAHNDVQNWQVRAGLMYRW